MKVSATMGASGCLRNRTEGIRGEGDGGEGHKYHIVSMLFASDVAYEAIFDQALTQQRIYFR